MHEDSYNVLNINTNDTYITNVEEFQQSLQNTTWDSNLEEYLINIYHFLKCSNYSNSKNVINLIKQKFADNGVELEKEEGAPSHGGR